MYAKLIVILFLVNLIRHSCQTSSLSSPYYTAGVVEFKRASSILTSLDQVNNNLASYLEIITSDEASQTDIIVFPEATLNDALESTYVPDPKDNIAPCNKTEYAYFLQKISCQAKSSQKYIVINLTEKENCTSKGQIDKKDPRPCANFGLNVFNTNVVFDRNGVVISRYRKFNLYYEPYNITLSPEYGHFATDFGVTFGHFICFDILFFTPATEMVKSGITDFIFPTMWFSELPFLTAVQTQQSWAFSYDVNLLAAGASNPATGNTGTGIYAGKKGAIISVMSSEPERKLYIARVPKKRIQNEDMTVQQLQIRKKRAITSYMKKLLVKRDSRIDKFSTSVLDFSTEKSHLCHKELCCHFSYKITKLSPSPNSKAFQYRLAAFDENRIYPGIDPLGWSVCSIIACINNTIQGCGISFDEDVIVSPEVRFENILIEANFTKTDNALLMPNSVDDSLMPLSVESFQFNVTDNGNKKNARFRLLSPRDDMINFGIYVNYFHEKSSASTASISINLMLFKAVVYFLSKLIKL